MNKTAVINEILSARAPILIMPTPSDGRNVGFLSDLVNFYRYTYWLSCECDEMTSFPLVFAERVLGEGEEYKKLLQYKHCEFEYNKDNVIIGIVLEKIAGNNADTLLIIDSLELLNDKNFDSQLEFLLKKCPKNLKVVLVSDRFIDLNYNNLDVCPRLIDLTDLVIDEPSFDLDTLSEEQRAFLSDAAIMRHLSSDFCNELLPDVTTFLEPLSRRAPALVLKKGDVYFFSKDFISSFEPARREEIRRRYVKFLFDRGRFISALDLSLKNGFFDFVDDIVDGVLETGEKTYALADYFRVNGDKDLDENSGDSVRKKFLSAVVRRYKRDTKKMAALAEEIIADSEKNSPLEIAGHYLKFTSMFSSGQYRASVDYARVVLNERLREQNGCPYDWVSILCRLPEAIKKCEIEVEEENFLFYEQCLGGEENVEKYWYAKALQAVAEVYFEWGNYHKAISLIDRLKARLPFYIIPYRLLDFYYYVGDMRLAYDVARQALRASKFHDIEADLTEVYLLLAKASAYLNRKEEAIKYVDYAVNLCGANAANKYLAIAYKAIYSAKAGRPGYGKDLVAVYEKSITARNNKGEHLLYCALAYCSYCLDDNADAEKYALKCEQRSRAKSGAWLLSRAIELVVRLKREQLDLTEVEKLFEQCKNYGMTTIVVNYYECFSPLFEYAKRSGLRLATTVEIRKDVRQRLDAGDRYKNVTARLFGDTYVGVNGKEIRWKTKKEKELFLLYLWKGKEGLDRSYIIEALWSDYLYESAVNNLKTTNFMVRKTLTEAGIEFTMRYANGRYYFSGDITTDLDLILRLMDSYEDTEQPYERLEIARKINALYHGGFCREIATPVFRQYREDVQLSLFHLFYRLALDMVAAGDYTVAVRIVRQMENENLGDDYSTQIEEIRKAIKEKRNED